jgi:hypothetical protein
MLNSHERMLIDFYSIKNAILNIVFRKERIIVMFSFFILLALVLFDINEE